MGIIREKRNIHDADHSRGSDGKSAVLEFEIPL